LSQSFLVSLLQRRFPFALVIRKEQVSAHGNGVDLRGLGNLIVMDREIGSWHEGLQS
jgi:hypothetical protein